jgi:hypothetical protein
LKEARITNITFYLWSTMGPVFVEHILSSRGKENNRKGKAHRGKGIKARSGGYGGNLSRSVIYTYIKAKEGPVNVPISSPPSHPTSLLGQEPVTGRGGETEF